MSKKFSDKLQTILKFLDTNEIDKSSLKKIKDVLNLPISTLKFLGRESQLITELFKIENIGEIAGIDIENPFKKLLHSKATKTKVQQILKNNPNFEEKVKKAITISLIIHRMKKEDIEIKKKEQKIIVLGLSNAGKTAILSKFGGKFGIKSLANLKPTRGLNRQKASTDEMNLAIWDFGGQHDYRDKYLRQPEKYFLGVNLVIFVIDIQSPELYDEAIEYFDSIISCITRLEENPYFLIFLHKYDPDLRSDSEVLLNVELLQDLVKSLFENKGLDYEMYLSSIYSMISREPKFARFLKDFMKDEAFIETSEEDRLEQIGKIVENAMNMMIQMSESMMKQFSALETRIAALEVKKTSGAPSHGPAVVPTPLAVSPPPPPPPPVAKGPRIPPAAPQGGMSARAAIVRELQELFAQRRKFMEL
ncbi:MAG: ADP-ribosylation factor-like protein [Promethearchaeota archaeon]